MVSGTKKQQEDKKLILNGPTGFNINHYINVIYRFLLIRFSYIPPNIPPNVLCGTFRAHFSRCGAYPQAAIRVTRLRLRIYFSGGQGLLFIPVHVGVTTLLGGLLK